MQNAGKGEGKAGYVSVCDGIRVISIFVIGWFHIWQQSWLYPGFTVLGRFISLDPLVRSGYMWVDLMILISGFCLYLPYTHLAEGDPLPDPLLFYRKRLARILPSYLLCIGICLIMALATGMYHTREFLIRDLLTHLTFTQLFRVDTYVNTNLNAALWTIVVEMQFYLLFPVLARGFRKRKLLVLFCALAVSSAYKLYLIRAVPDTSIYFNQLPAYIDVFVLGMMAAQLHTRLSARNLPAAVRIFLGIASLGVFIGILRLAAEQSAAGSFEEIRTGQMIHRLPMALLGCLWILTAANAGRPLQLLLGNRVMKFAASVSMQFYIWHQTLAVWILRFRLIPSEFENPNYSGDHTWQVTYTLACFAVAFVVSVLLTYCFEKPIARFILNRKNGRNRTEPGT